MTHYRLMVESNALPGREADYHEFYNNRHTADILRLPGVQNAQRFKITGLAEGPARFLMIVDYETDDLQGLLTLIRKKAGSEEMPNNPAIDIATVKITVLEAITPLKTP